MAYKQSEKRRFATAVLQRLGVAVDEGNIQNLLRWMEAEDSRQSASPGSKNIVAIDRFNPFNTTYALPGSVDVNDVKVKGYKSFEDGVDATVKTLQSKNYDYSPIVDALKTRTDFSAFKKAIGSTPWGTFRGGVSTETEGGASLPGSINQISTALINRAFLVDKEVGRIFQEFKGKQGPDVEAELKARLQQTKFWQGLSANIKKNIFENLSLDQPSYNEKFTSTVDAIKDKFTRIGAPTPDQGTLDDLAKKTLLFGLKDDQLDEIVFDSVRFDTNYIAGKAGEFARTIYNNVLNYGGKIDTNSAEFKNYVFDALRTNGASISSVTERFANLASQAYPTYADRFKAGATLRDVASPFLQDASQYLETQITDLNDPLIQRGLVGGMNRLDFLKEIKKTPQWQYTYNATEEILGTLQGVLEDFGFRF
jgi:hypothetical protein